MITLRQLTKRFGRTLAVDDLTLEVRPGVVTGFLGPNGAGKSTTVRMVVGLDHPTSGQALIGGRRYADLTRPLYQVGAVLDARAVHPHRSGRNHLLWMARSNGIPARRVDEVLGIVGLQSVAGRRAAATATSDAWATWRTHSACASTSCRPSRHPGGGVHGAHR